MRAPSRTRDGTKRRAWRTRSRPSGDSQNPRPASKEVLLAGHVKNRRKIRPHVPQLPEIQAKTTRHGRENARNELGATVGSGLHRLGGSSATLHCRTCLTPRNARSLHKMDWTTPYKDGHRKRRGESREGPYLSMKRLPGRYSHRQRTPVRKPRVQWPLHGVARPTKADPVVYTLVQSRREDQPCHKDHVGPKHCEEPEDIGQKDSWTSFRLQYCPARIDRTLTCLLELRARIKEPWKPRARSRFASGRRKHTQNPQAAGSASPHKS